MKKICTGIALLNIFFIVFAFGGTITFTHSAGNIGSGDFSPDITNVINGYYSGSGTCQEATSETPGAITFTFASLQQSVSVDYSKGSTNSRTSTVITAYDGADGTGSQVGTQTKIFSVDGNSGTLTVNTGSHNIKSIVISDVYDNGAGGLTSYNDYDNLTYDTALPVELISFTGQLTDKGVELTWTTATELNNYGFEIQRAVAGDQAGTLKWEKAGFVEGHNNSNTPLNYSFTDEVPVNLNLEYRLKQIDADGSFKYSGIVKVDIANIPGKFELSQNYPNPFNPGTTVKFALPADSRVVLNVYNLLGEKVAELVNKELPAGYHRVKFDGSSFASGVYIYKLQAGDFSAVKKFILMK